MKTITPLIFICLLSLSLKAQNPCLSANPIPQGNSCLNNNVLPGTEMWFGFVPDSMTVQITLTNFPSTSPGHVHNMTLLEGLCPQGLSSIASVSEQPGDSTLKIKAYELIPGIPYFIQVSRDVPGCLGCVGGGAIFNICIQNLLRPVQTESTGMIFLDGSPTYMKDEIIVRISKTYLKMNAVDDVNKQDMPIPVFVQPAMIQKMANQIFHGDAIGLGNLHLKKVFPKLTSADTISISRIGTTVRIPEFWETFILTVPDTMKIFRASRGLNRLSGMRYAEPNYVRIYNNVPNDNFYASNQASLHPTTTYPFAHINVEGAWDIETGKSFVKIGVVDGGVDQNHSELNNNKVGGGFNYFGNALLSAPYDNNPFGHGTSCAGIIGAYRNNITGIAGIAGGDGSVGNPGCTLFDMKVSDNSTFGSEANITRAYVDGATSVCNAPLI